MLTVREAHFRRVIDGGGRKLAEIEVSTGNPRDPQLLAYFRAGPEGGYPLVRVIENDAAYEVDWYDNSMHAAYDDVTAQLFASPDHMAPHDRDDFAAQVVGYGEIREELERNLR